MRTLSAADLVKAWEDGSARRPAVKACILLGMALPELTPEGLLDLPVGQVNTLLLVLRAQTFGGNLEGFAECPACGESLEIPLSSAELLSPAKELGAAPPKPAILEAAGYRVEVRLPSSRDLEAVLPKPELGQATSREAVLKKLLQRCILRAEQDGVAVAPAELPAAVIEQIDGWFSTADPLALLTLTVDCSACHHQWEANLDVVEYFFREIAVQARRLLRDVHTLAREYGWSEAAILAMSETRRQGYLDLVGGA
jgi:hypothetical protein